MNKLTTSTALPTRALKLEALANIVGELRVVVPCFGHGSAWRDDGSRCASDLWSTPCTRSYPAGAPVGKNEG